MSEQPGQDRQIAEERVDFGEYFEKSAQILANEPAQDFESTLDDAVFGGTVGFLIAGKVLSPQYMLWIAPLLPLVANGFVGSFLALTTAVLTTVVYPYLSPALEQRAPGHGWALLAIGSRNLLLLGWYGVACFRAAGFRLRSKRLTELPGVSVSLSNQEGRL